MNSEIYKKDLENRFPTYTFEEGVNGDMATFTAINANKEIIASSGPRPALIDAIWNVRCQLVGGHEIQPTLTTIQINELSNITCGTKIFDLTTETGKTCITGTWK